MQYEPTAEMMSEGKLFIVTGPIDSGKTGWCRELAAADPERAGLLLLKVYLHGERIGYDALRLPDGLCIPFARVEGHEPSGWKAGQRIGPFSISPAGLRSANAWLTEAAAQPADIIIDEIGPLELDDGGLSPGLRTVLASPMQRRLYLVIRSDCVEAVCAHFGIEGYTLVDIGAGLQKRDLRKRGLQKRDLPKDRSRNGRARKA
jgi:nucleoside-triphosphatase THEP1